MVPEIYGLLSSHHFSPLEALGMDDFKCLWNIGVSSKASAFVWKVMLDKIQTKSYLWSWDWNNDPSSVHAWVCISFFEWCSLIPYFVCEDLLLFCMRMIALYIFLYRGGNTLFLNGVRKGHLLYHRGPL